VSLVVVFAAAAAAVAAQCVVVLPVRQQNCQSVSHRPGLSVRTNHSHVLAEQRTKRLSFFAWTVQPGRSVGGRVCMKKVVGSGC
jgi:hypothetical protein